MGMEAARLALRNSPGASPSTLWFSTTAPAYLDKTNAAAIHAALRLGRAVLAADAGGAARSGVAALRASLDCTTSALVVAADIRGGRAGGPDEAAGGDGAAALFVGDEHDGPVLAGYLGSASASEEFLDRWRVPGEDDSRQWEERFGEDVYVPLAQAAFADALKAAGVSAEAVDHLIVAGLHTRAVKAVGPKLGTRPEAAVPYLTATIGNLGAAQLGVSLADVLDRAAPGDVIAAVVLGGTSIFGGSGTIWGTVIGLVMIQLLKDGLALTGVKGDATIIVIGAVLIASTLLASSLQKRREFGG